MESQHRKIELQSPSDLTYLTSLLRGAAVQKLNLHLPPVVPTSNDNANNANEPDDLRRHVESLVDAFVAQVLHGMRQNISINGIDVVSAEGSNGAGLSTTEESVVEKEEFEAFDEKLRAQLGAAVARRDALVAKISQHRRETAKSAAEGFVRGWEGDEVRINEASKVMFERASGVEDEDEDEVVVTALQRQEEVERNWERAVQGLQRLNKGLPETRARLERAGDVLGYLEGQQQGKGR